MKPGPVFHPGPCSECGVDRKPNQGAKSLCKTCYTRQRRAKDGVCAYCGVQLETRPNNGKSHDACRDRIKESYRRQRRRVIDAYGSSCECCGETEYVFLTIDHENDDGNEHRKLMKNQGGVYRDLERRGYPPGYVVRCFNCNLGRQVNGGVCPHKEG